MAARKPVSKTKKSSPKKVVKKSLETEVLEAIFDECNSNENILLLDYNKNRAILVKKHVASVRRLRNTNIHCMQPMEDFYERNFFHTFILTWVPEAFAVPTSQKLVGMGFPIIHVQSAYDVIEAVKAQ